MSTWFSEANARAATRIGRGPPKLILGVCQHLAMAQLRFCNPSTACAGGTTSRFGEASSEKPLSPALAQEPENRGLETWLLLEPATVALQDSAWRHFESWLLQALSPGDVESLRSCPQLALLLVEFGYSAYKTGLPLYLYRQLLAKCKASSSAYGAASQWLGMWLIAGRSLNLLSTEYLCLNLCCMPCWDWLSDWVGISSDRLLCWLSMLLRVLASCSRPAGLTC